MLSDAAYFNIIWFSNEKNLCLVLLSFLCLSACLSLSFLSSQLGLVYHKTGRKLELEIADFCVTPGKNECKAKTR